VRKYIYIEEKLSPGRWAEGNYFFSQGLAGIITVSKNVSIRTYNALSCMAEIERERGESIFNHPE
jgi:hypothetical protein